MPTETEKQTYVYVQNNDPANTSTFLTYEGQTVAQGEEITLTADQAGFLSQWFVLEPTDGKPVEPEPEVVPETTDQPEEQADQDVSTSDSAGTLKDTKSTAAQRSSR